VFLHNGKIIKYAATRLMADLPEHAYRVIGLDQVGSTLRQITVITVSETSFLPPLTLEVGQSGRNNSR
jgi:hypothetical protein